MPKKFLSLQEQAALEAERIERARAANRHAKMLLLSKEPVPDPKPDPNPDYVSGHYTGLTWRGHKIIIRKNKYGW